MKTIVLAVLASAAAAQVAAQTAREAEAHVHGVSTLELAVEDGALVLNLVSPGADVVGFEYEPGTAEDRDAVEAAIRTMLVPENIVTLPEAAECRLTELLVGRSTGAADHEAHDHEAHDHDGHDEDAHEEDDDHADADSQAHSEFHLRYAFACEHPENLASIAFPFFERFENAHEIEARFITDAGAGSAEIARATGVLTLR